MLLHFLHRPGALIEPNQFSFVYSRCSSSVTPKPLSLSHTHTPRICNYQRKGGTRPVGAVEPRVVCVFEAQPDRGFCFLAEEAGEPVASEDT